MTSISFYFLKIFLNDKFLAIIVFHTFTYCCVINRLSSTDQ